MWVYVEYTGQAGAEAAGNTDPTPIHVSLRGKHKKFQFVTEFPSPLAWLDNGGSGDRVGRATNQIWPFLCGLHKSRRMKGKLLYSHVLQPTAQCEPHLVTCELQAVDCLTILLPHDI